LESTHSSNTVVKHRTHFQPYFDTRENYKKPLMHNIIFGILFLSNLLLSPVIFAEENEEEQLSISSMLKDLRGETNENQDYIPSAIKNLRKEIKDQPIKVENSALKQFYCRDYPDLVENDVCWCGTEDMLYADQLQIEKDLLAQFSACWMVPAGVVIEDWMMMKVSVEYNQDGTIKPESVTLLETNIPKSNSFYEPIIESTIYSMCKKVDLPPEEYNQWEKIVINFDFSKIN